MSSGAAYLADFDIQISVLSAVHSNVQVPIHDLTAAHFTTAKRKLTGVLMKCGLTSFIGGLDISANEDDPNLNPTRIAANLAPVHEFEPHWQIQAWVLAPTELVTAAEPNLRKRFPKSASTPRPVKIKTWDGNPAALAYALKTEFARRVRYFRPPTPHRHGCINTRDRSLRVNQQLGLMIALDKAGLHSRLLLGGCRVVQTHSGPMIRSINGQPVE